MNNPKLVIILEIMSKWKQSLLAFVWMVFNVMALNMCPIPSCVYRFRSTAEQTTQNDKHEVGYLRRFLYRISYSWLFLYVSSLWLWPCLYLCLCLASAYMTYHVHQQLNYMFKASLQYSHRRVNNRRVCCGHLQPNTYL